MKHLKSLLTILLLLIGVGTNAALPTTGYYRIKSHNSKYLTENVSSNTLICADEIAGSYSQVWYLNVSGSNVTIKNVLSDKYIQGQGTFSKQYSTGISSQNFTIAEESSVFTFEYDGTYHGGLHCDNSNVVVEWYISDSKSKWTVEAATVDAAELTSQRNAFWEGSLSAFFTTTACTELNDTYKSYSDNALRSAMAAMPTTVQDMAVKVKNNSWTTYAGWDKTEKTFRIADYKAYSSSSRWTNILGLGHTFGRLTNPTGISVSAGEYLQVYVGAIPSGQAVKLEVAGQYQATGTIYTLHQGINALLMVSSGNCFVYYEVDNTTTGNAPYTAIASYAPVTIHIEGGTVNGYFDLTKNDDNDDWAKLQANLLSGSSVDIKTSNLLFHMNTDLVKDACPTKMVEMLGEWDKILDMEYNLMGLEDFDGYWNNLLSVTDMSGEDYMHASDYGTFYDVGTIDEVMSYDDLFAGGALWGPAHENGHIFQKYINMVGCTEVSNNLFSNAAIFNNGHLTSRATNISVTFENMANNVFWNDRDIWERTHLYFQLYQFFHILGNDSDFFPELFKALRSDPMVHTGNTFISATDDYLKFYKKCCSVSGYDLTEFFQAYGFFVIPTLTSYTLSEVTKDAFKIGDYGNYYLTVTQAEIDAAKQAVADMGLPKANIIFIEDRITAPVATYEGAPSGAKKTAFAEEYPIGLVGETGQYTTFGETPSAYTYYINANGGVTVQGKGAVGFKLYDSGDNLIALYNTLFFTLPSEAFDAEGLKTGYTLKAAAGDGSDAAMTYDASARLNTSLVPTVVGRQVTKESMLVSGRPYLVYYVGNGNSAFLKDTGSAYTGKSDEVATEAAVYYFINDGTGWKIKNYSTGKYWGTPTANANTYIGVAEEASAGSWALNFLSSGKFAPNCNEHSLNRSGSNIHPWSVGTAAENQLAIFEVEDVEPLAGLGDLTGDGWYRLRMTASSSYEKLYIQNNSNEQNYNSDRYPLTYQGSVVLPTVDDASYYVKIIRNGGNVQIQSANGHYLNGDAKAVLSATNVAVSYDTGFKLGDAYLPFESSGNRILGKSSYTKTTRFALYPMSIGGQNLQAWKVILVDIPDTYWTFSCTRGDAKGLTTVYNNGYIFLPLSVTPTAGDFTMLGMKSCVVDTENKTITATFDETISLAVDNTQVIQGNQTTGKGNTMQALLRVKTTTISACTPTTFTINVTGADQLSKVAVYTTSVDEINAAGVSPVKIGEADAAEGTVVISVTASEQAKNATQYYWITADVKADATEWATVDASISSIAYSNTNGGNTLDLSSIGDPDGDMRIYKQQQFLWTSSTTTNKYYRIPTIMKTKDGGIVALADYRHEHPYDLGKTATNGSGGHVIDVVSRRNADCGNTWESEVNVAVGDGTNEASYGYGDPAIVRDNDGTLHCLMAAGSKSYASGMLHMGYSKSTDNGASWTEVTDIYSSIYKGALTITSAFTTGGKGVTFDNGRMAFAFLGNVSGTTNIYPIYSDDKGANWKLGTAAAYTGGDETKFEIMNDNSLLASVKIVGYNATGNRGKNSTTGVASGDGISTWNTQGSWNGNMVGNGCNADIIYYSRITEGKRDVLLHTLTKSYSTHRKDLRLYMSFDKGSTWHEAFQLQPGWAAYSSMQVLDNGDLAIIFEDGSIGNEDKNDCYAINYVTISKETLQARIAELNGPDVTYHIMFNGSEVASNATPEILLNTATTAIPNELERAFCTYQYYSDAGLTSAITQVGTNQDIYVKCTSSAPFEYSTELAPKWFFIHSREQSDANDYFANADGTTFRMTAQADVATLYANDAYKWAFIGSPYSVRLINKGTGKPLAATANSGSNGSNLPIGVTDNSVSHPYDEFVVYGYGGILNESSGVTNAFTLILKDTEYAFLDYNGTMKYYSSGVSINASLGLKGWRSSDMMTIEASDVVTISAACTDGEGNYYGTYSKGTAFVVPSDLTVSEIQVVDGKLKLTNYATDAIVPANTGVLVSSTTPGNHTIILAAGGTSVLGSDNLLKPSGDAGINAEGMAAAAPSCKYYRLTMHNGTELGFWWGAAEGGAFNLAANKAYLAVPSGVSVKGFSLSADDLTDGISQIEDGKLNIENAIYDLSGRRISVSSVSSERSVLPKGVYIVNGKKYIKK